jgi:hypothetical protein
MVTCSFAMPPVPMPLTAIPTGPPVQAGTPAATVMDHLPMANIPSFGMCGTMSNPAVAAATAAKLGVFSPAPCVPVIPAPWAPGATQVTINNAPALHAACQAMCTWGGVITVTSPGNAGTVQVT